MLTVLDLFSGIGGDFIQGMATGTLRACLIVWDASDYEATKRELEAAAQPKEESRG